MCIKLKDHKVSRAVEDKAALMDIDNQISKANVHVLQWRFVLDSLEWMNWDQRKGIREL